MRSENLGYICERVEAYEIIGNFYTADEICGLREIVFWRNENNGIILKKFSPLHDIIASMWFWMRETGIYSRLYRYWSIQKPKCMLQSRFIQVGFNYLGSLLIFLCAMQFISFIIFIGEILGRNFVNKHI